MCSFECTNSVLKITKENNSFSITIPNHWNSKSGEKPIDELHKVIEFRSENNIVLYIEQVRKKGRTLMKDYSSSNLEKFKDQILEELKNSKYNDLEDMVYRFQLTNGEIIDVSDIKYIPTKRTGYYLNPGFYELVDLNNTLKYFLTNDVKVSVTIDDVRLKSN